MFVVACFTSPCCAPLYVPLALALLAGTPAAGWLTANVGWVYGALTLVSLASAVLAVRWCGAKHERAASPAPREQVERPNATFEEVIP
jgi:predicted MFS family arabinose efflux permease